MRVKFWGTRGSIPVAPTTAAIRQKLVAALTQAAGRQLDTPARIEAFVDGELDWAVRHTFGGNSSCVQLDAGDPYYVLCDLGSGVRALGNHALATRRGEPAEYHVFMSHTHWDHIMGFPFFMPAYIPGNVITIYGCHAWLEEAIRRQHGAPSFPVEFAQLGLEVLDPLLSMVSHRIDSYKAHEVRLALDPLKGVAERTQVSLLAIHHLNKSRGTDPAQLLTGSGAFKDFMRTILIFASDEPNRGVISQEKNSYGPKHPESLAYRIDPPCPTSTDRARATECTTELWTRYDGSANLAL